LSEKKSGRFSKSFIHEYQPELSTINRKNFRTFLVKE